jgi:hypothetical protein
MTINPSSSSSSPPPLPCSPVETPSLTGHLSPRWAKPFPIGGVQVWIYPNSMAFLPPYTPRHLARSFLQTLTMAAPRRIPCMLLAAAAAFLLLAVADARTLSQDAAGARLCAS